MTAKESFSMYGTVLAIALGAGGVVWSAGFQSSDIRHLEKQVTQLQQDQSTVGSIQVEQAVQGGAIDSLKEDVSEIKDDQREIKADVKQGQQENRANFQKILEAIQQ